MSTKAIPEMSADNRVLVSEISRHNRGDVITYAEHFTKWLGKPIRNRHDLPNFQTVINKLRSEYGIVLAVIRGLGYKLLDHKEVAGNSNRIDRMAHHARIRRKELATVDQSSFTEPEKLNYVCEVTRTHMIAETCKDKAIKKLASVANGHTEVMPLAIAFERMKANV